MTEPIKLYQLRDLAVVFGVGSSAISNWIKRGTGPSLPEPMYVTTSGKPLFTEEQVRILAADQAAKVAELLHG